jgi:hypothetical protein
MKMAKTAIAIVALGALGACGQRDKKTDDPPPPTVSSAPAKPPPVLIPVPVTQFADAGDIDGKPPFEQATEYYATGQVWKARLILESKALSDSGTKPEAELLAKICNDQGDEACLERCSAKLGRKLKFDGGAPKTLPSGGIEHSEPDSDLERARTLHLKKKDAEAHKILAPKVIDGKASPQEIQMLKMICDSEGDKMCVALCASKLK